MSKSEYYKHILDLQSHPEGGYYKETYRAKTEIKVQGFKSTRNVSTAIYFLLENDNKSHFHKIKSDELWFYHDGNTLEIYVLHPHGLEIIYLGKDLEKGESLQAIIPANTWFASKVKDNHGFVLVSCTVAPGFSFDDFEMANKLNLLIEFPSQSEIVNLLCLN